MSPASTSGCQAEPLVSAPEASPRWGTPVWSRGTGGHSFSHAEESGLFGASSWNFSAAWHRGPGACSLRPPCLGCLEPSPGCDSCWSRPLQDSGQASISAAGSRALRAGGAGVCRDSGHHGGVGRPGSTQDPDLCQAPRALRALGQEPARPRLPRAEAPPPAPCCSPWPRGCANTGSQRAASLSPSTTGARGSLPVGLLIPDGRWL